LSLDHSSLRERVRVTYSKVADDPNAEHPFRVGRRVAERAGYPQEMLSTIAAPTVDAFAGISCLPCFADIPAGARVLDLGCGAGLDSLLIARRAGSVLGMDFSSAMLNIARHSAESMGVANVEFREGDAESIPVDPGSIDVVLVNGIFNLNPDRTAIFDELARVTRRGGVVFAAELVLKGPLPDGVESTETDWFS
jgi:arsenite methyltransferase